MAKKLYGALTLVPLANATPKAMALDASGNVIESTTSAAELAFVAGVTSAIQTQVNGKEATLAANEKIDHSTVSVTTAADSGLSGGGDITASRTLVVDIAGTTVGTAAGTDEVLVSQSGTRRKVTLSAIAALASTPSFKDTWLNATGVTKVINHALNSTDVIVQIFDIATGETITIDTIERTDADNVTVTASEAPGVSWRVLILAI